MLGALKGVRIIACEQVLAGPYCTQVLSDLGAEIIKVEPPGGEVARSYPPRFIDPLGSEHSLYFAGINRNKKSIVIDLKKEKGLRLLLKLLECSDVLLSNFRSGVMERLGLDLKTLHELNPRLINATISGFGHPEAGGASPYSSRPAYDIIAQAAGGIMSVTGQEDGAPTRVGVSLGDMAGGLFSAIGILAALVARERSGCGEHVDVSMTDAVTALMANAFSSMGAGEVYNGPIGSRHPVLAPFDTFLARDGYIVIAAASDSTWKALCRAMGMNDLIEDTRFVNNEARLQNRQELKRIVEKWTAVRTRDDIIEILSAEGCPAGPVNSVQDLLTDPHVASRGMKKCLNWHGRDINIIGNPVKHSSGCEEGLQLPPGPGEHTRYVLETVVKLDPEEVSRLFSEGVVF